MVESSFYASSSQANQSVYNSSVKSVGKIRVFLNQKIGSGVTSSVYTGLYKSQSNRDAVKAAQFGTEENIQKIPVAIKVFQLKMIKKRNMQKMLNQEFAVLNRVKHRNIVEFLGYERTRNAFYFIFELCEGGDLQAYLNQRGALSELEAQKFFKQIADAMITLNREDVIHCDLKPANILMTKDEKLKLADFGLARQINTQSQYDEPLVLDNAGTPIYKAPEVYH